MRLSIIFSLLLLLVSGTGLLAQQDGQASGKKQVGEKPLVKAQAKPKPDQVITPEREAAVMTFVESNHAELKDLLTHLRENRRKDYERAIRELSRDAERINQIKQRDPDLYELQLKAWTIKSRIQLLTARLAMGESEELKSQLRSLVSQQLDARTALLKLERSRVDQRLAKMDQELSRLEVDRQRMIENQLKVLTKSAADSKTKVKVSRKDATRPPKKPDGGKSGRPTVNAPGKPQTSPK